MAIKKKSLEPYIPSYKGYLLAGVDEVGRGPLVGAVVTSAVILNPNKPIQGLADSKKLTEAKRNQLYDEIVEKALCWSLGRAEAIEIDQINIYHATLLAMKRAIENLSQQPEFVLIDGNRCPDISLPCEAVVKGDSRVACISAASILAKVTRDREMQVLDSQYPEFGFAKHKGYPTKQHLQALNEYGVIPQHRKSFGPVANQVKCYQPYLAERGA
jgi:ribonuclease HII